MEASEQKKQEVQERVAKAYKERPSEYVRAIRHFLEYEPPVETTEKEKKPGFFDRIFKHREKGKEI